ncbi:nucleotidyl transferase AbiEii/AbiGii toxin family protein [Marivirga salinae]|uniref:Nucleotidyl transferase AbiEii/AbiGii toxin family protein n=1 Tax=Marivirga salinarum TaxID=3059078 RepID=A0AA51R8K1_9BACT|nr:nucleotidyl transferase AbiEii/AbiGii toxin family protein [Marivirga sp. BDSF4-3]WMN11297.1 nucleotidyl transferase AbiEii/AbiGii toxin family protein [Marivirga sp. BDSF4-3]
MLYKESITNETLDLLKSLTSENLLTDFFLVGGTALALQIGHRKSIDLDFFSSTAFDSNQIQNLLINKYQFQIDYQAENTILGYINDVKIDFISHQYPQLAKIENIEGLRLANIKDIGAMKLNAICNRGSKKDFVDIFLLMDTFSLGELILFYQKKYNQTNSIMVLKSILFFDDAELEPEPIYLSKQIVWEDIKEKITTEAKKLFKN